MVEEDEKTLEDGRVIYEYATGPRIESVFGTTTATISARSRNAFFNEYPVDDLPVLFDRVYTEFSMMDQNSAY
ncbi:hypothetical protein KI372_01415 [Halobacterium salinarum]|uniref:hypothetical protein n=1 Tax=Halobacterium salinarum TaxID=2242 RepID=UPI001F3AEDA7|nr:hypothetical protein [Halobacterium salinarum]MCF2206770.1 hypothetical protein [Halobacterium salinarum]MCF2240118.1 hypothetical protein [Halobacterium salinarum]